MRDSEKNIFLVIFICCLPLMGCDDLKKDFQEGYVEGKRNAFTTDAGSAETPGSGEQYLSEEFRYKRGGLLGYQLMNLEPIADGQLERIGFVDDSTKKQLASIFDELEVIAKIEKDEEELIFIQKQRVKYSL